MLQLLDLSLEILLTNIHKKYLSRIKNEIDAFRTLPYVYLQQPLTTFAKSSIIEVYLTDFPKFASDYETKTKTTS